MKIASVVFSGLLLTGSLFAEVGLSKLIRNDVSIEEVSTVKVSQIFKHRRNPRHVPKGVKTPPKKKK